MLQRVNIALTKAHAALALRTPDETDPLTWEFSGFSQNKEDGIIDFLVRRLLAPNRYFVEIGASNGVENNTTWLGIVHKYSGIMIEGDKKSSDALELLLSLGLCIGVEQRRLFVTKEACRDILSWSLFRDPDVLSIDIDGNDYHVAQELLQLGMKPKIIVVEYNSTFGPTRQMTIPYIREFTINRSGAGMLYYGASVGAWKSLMKKNGYRFITVDSNGVNAFFVNERAFKNSFLRKIQGCSFEENFFQRNQMKMLWQNQFKLIEHLKFDTV